MYSLENTRFFLEFTENNRIEIAEPTGFDGSHFTLLQENGRMGRDVAFSGETLEFNPTVNIEGLTHQFDTLIQYYDNKGFEGEILFIINIKGVDYVIGQLDFTNAETDRIKYLRCSLIQDTKQAIIKRHLQTNVDLYSDKDITGNIEITPLVPKKIFLPALPLKQSSEWDIPESQPVYGWFDYTNIIVTLNPFNFITKVAIEDTLSPTADAILHPDTVADRFANMEVLRAVNSLSDIVVKFIDCNWILSLHFLIGILT